MHHLIVSALFALVPVLQSAPAQPAPAQSASAQPAPAASSDLPRRAGPLGIRFNPTAPGLLVVEAVPNSVAARAGILPGDSITAIDATPLANREALAEFVRTRRGGEVLSISLRRDNADLQLPLTLEVASESVEGSTVEYASVTVPAGYRLRTILTRPNNSPLARDGRHPAFLYVQGIICQSIDRPNIPQAADTRLVHAIANAGFITMRIDKPGLGDSEGPPCSDIDFQTELDGFAAALRQLASMPDVDPDRIYIFGHSMGGVIAPYLSHVTPVRGTIVYGTLARTWFEYQLENVRRQAALSPNVSEADITDAVLAETRTSATILVDKKTLGDAWNRWPELRQPAQGTMLDENHIATRSMPFFHQLQDLNLARAWQDSTGAVLAIYGEYDWVTSLHDHEKIAHIVNSRTPNAGSFLMMPKADHGFTTHDSLEESVPRMGQGEWDANLPPRILEWIATVEGRAQPAAQPPAQPAPAPAPAAAAAPATESALTWTKLTTEPYPGKQDDITFVNPRVGWYGNGAGKLFRTLDGGDSWTKVWEQPGTFIRCLAFFDESVGVLGNIGPGYFPGVTDPVPLYRTQDAGLTWTPITTIEGPPVVGLCALEIISVPFVNAGQLDHRPRIVGVGRVGGPAAYIWSDDLGQTWKQGTLPDLAAMAFDIHFIDERRGFIASSTSTDVAVSSALILATDDAGATWREVYRSTRPFELTWKFSFPSNSIGYCTIQSYNPDPTASQRFIAQTTDAGQTWSEIPLIDDHRIRQFGVAFLDANTGWVGATPHGFATTDGGATWSRASFGNAVNKIRILRSDEGITAFAIGTHIHRLRIPADAKP